MPKRESTHRPCPLFRGISGVKNGRLLLNPDVGDDRPSRSLLAAFTMASADILVMSVWLSMKSSRVRDAFVCVCRLEGRSWASNSQNRDNIKRRSRLEDSTVVEGTKRRDGRDRDSLCHIDGSVFVSSG